MVNRGGPALRCGRTPNFSRNIRFPNWKEWPPYVQKDKYIVLSSSVMGAPADDTLATLQELLKDLKHLSKNIKHDGRMLNTPLIEDIEDCCIPSALRCFKEMLPGLTTTDEQKSQKVKKMCYKMSNKTIDRTGNVCTPEEVEKASCRACDSYEMKDSKDFLNAMEKLLQKSVMKMQ
ncbi:interleukin-21 isoform X2 [Lepisosteus oculatus]|uniref:interleukin-21 isoform X2 n=1 Tax=Lepisosteus oculatus TaxID=7918 RepID=UPI0035F50748